MEKKSNVTGVLVCLLVFLFVAVLMTINVDTGAENCLRGNVSACAYFEAREEVEKIQQQLDVAKENLATAKQQYQTSQK